MLQINDREILKIATAAAAADGQELETWVNAAIRSAARSKVQKRKDALDEIRQAQVEAVDFYRQAGCSNDVAFARAADLELVAILIDTDARKEKDGG
jgi:hypothetical protein